jgi:hypothetical protein
MATTTARRKVVAPIVVTALLVVACGSTVSPAPSAVETPEAPSSVPLPTTSLAPTSPPSSPSPASSQASAAAIDPANFVAVIDNPWLPFIPGTTLRYVGAKDGKKAIDTVKVTGQTKIVAGVTCIVVHDDLTLDGKREETTEDYYVQDRQGNVWYFGEATAELDEAGHVTSTEGSWETGVDGATPGVFMPADPTVGYSGLQEYLAGHAEDRFVVLLTNVPVKVPAGSYSGALLTAEWTRLEPDVLTEKFYVKGTGEVREVDVAGGDEHQELASVVHR